jgi:hypothetical protein
MHFHLEWSETRRFFRTVALKHSIIEAQGNQERLELNGTHPVSVILLALITWPEHKFFFLPRCSHTWERAPVSEHRADFSQFLNQDGR